MIIDYRCTTTAIDESGDGVINIAFQEKNNPYIENQNLVVTEAFAAANPILAVTLKQSGASGPSHLRATYPNDLDPTKGATKAIDIQPDLTTYKTYYINLAGTHWGAAGTLSETKLKLTFKNVGNTTYTPLAGASVSITKIELLSEIPLPEMEIADTTFDINDDYEEWITNQNGTPTVSGGALSIDLVPSVDPASNQMVKIDHIGTDPINADDDYLGYIDTDTKKYLYVWYKNIGVTVSDTTYNDQLRFQWKIPGVNGNKSTTLSLTENMTNADGFEVALFDFTGNENWVGNTNAFQFSIKNITYQDGEGFGKGTTTKGTFIIDRILFSSDGTLGTKAINKDDVSLALYPNPATDVLNFKIPNNKTIKQATVHSLLGQKVLETKNTSQLDVRSLNIGMYILKLEMEDGTASTKRFMVK